MERERKQLPATYPDAEYIRSTTTAENNLDMMDYVIHRLIPGLTAGWTLPMHLMKWTERWSLRNLPRSVHEWSAPLPCEQWASPSNELVDASQLFRKEYGLAGQNISSGGADTHSA